MAKFRLTYLFLIFSVAITAVTIAVLNRVSADVGERSLINLSAKLAETDARLIGGALEEIAMSEVISGSGGQTMTVADIITSMNGGDPLAVLLSFLGPEILEPLSVVSLSIASTDGQVIWSLGSDTSDSPEEDEQFYQMLRSAVEGEPVSVLGRQTVYMDMQGNNVTADVVTSLVPLGNGDSTPYVMIISRDMSSDLASEIATTRSSMFKVTLASLGGLLAVLLVFIVAIDMHLWRSHQRLLAEERMHAQADQDREELKRLNEAKDRFISTVSHELKTPLTTIMGYAQILRRNRKGNLDETQIEQLQTVQKSGWRLDLLIDDMLDISRIESGRMTTHKSEFEVMELIDELEKSFQPIVAAKGQRLIVSSSGPAGSITADRARVMQCVSNLVTNASKYSPEGSTIRILAEVNSGRLRISVKDEGIGISAEDQEKLFTLFFRADNRETRAQSGLGLGLFIVSAIVEAHDGHVDVQSAPGNGTTITVDLPGVHIMRKPATAPEQGRLKPTTSRLHAVDGKVA